ncbi:MAG TPA: tetratricopeptide repeat protein [Spirochaetia bacterium]|nr:tetratricopeptide repeat protein [Spirochaetia bacterium]
MRARIAAAAVLIACVAAVGLSAQDKPDALELYRAGKYPDAIKVCQQELAISPNNIDSYVVMGWSLLRLQQYADALAAGQKATAISPTDPRVVQILGEADVFLGKIPDALTNLQQYVVLRPNGDRIGRVYWLMGECYIRLKQFQNADIALSTAVYYEQNNALWWTRLGYARELGNDLQWSSDAYGHALKLDPGQTDAQRGKDGVDKKLKG